MSAAKNRAESGASKSSIGVKLLNWSTGVGVTATSAMGPFDSLIVGFTMRVSPH